MIYSNSVAAIVREKNRFVLLDHVKFGQWTIPIGKCDKGESPVETLFREMDEELGIIVPAFQLVKVADRQKGDKVWSTHVYKILEFAGPITNKEPEKHKSLILASFQEMTELYYQGKLHELTAECFGFKQLVR